MLPFGVPVAVLIDAEDAGASEAARLLRRAADWLDEGFPQFGRGMKRPPSEAPDEDSTDDDFTDDEYDAVTD